MVVLKRNNRTDEVLQNDEARINFRLQPRRRTALRETSREAIAQSEYAKAAMAAPFGTAFSTVARVVHRTEAKNSLGLNVSVIVE